MFWFFDVAQTKLRYTVLISSRKSQHKLNNPEEHAFYKPLSLRIKTPETVFLLVGTMFEQIKKQIKLSKD